MKKLIQTILAALCVSTSLACIASATIHTFTISLDPSQVVPPTVTSSGSGSGTATFDDATGILSWQFSVSGLTGAVIDADFHAPAAAGTIASKVVDAFGGYSGSSGSGSASGSITISTPSAELLSNLWYLSVATSYYSSGDGEIRGQLIRVLPPPSPPAVDYSKKIAKLESKIEGFELKIERARSNPNFTSLRTAQAHYDSIKKRMRKKIAKLELKIRKLKALG